MKRLFLFLLALALGGPAGTTLAAPGGLPTNIGNDDASPEWEKLRAALFPGRQIHQGVGYINLDIPPRAQFGATVPVRIRAGEPQTSDLYVRNVWLIIDKNPSPVGAVLHFTKATGKVDVETRIRVQEYSHVRVIAEMSDGQFHMDQRYVKTSGGCSAPPQVSQEEHTALLGKMNVRFLAPVKLGAPNLAQLQISHPNNSGFELDQFTNFYIPQWFVRTIKVSYGDEVVMSADTDISISESPLFRFNFVPKAAGELKIEAEDTKDNHWVHVFPVKPGEGGT